MKEKSKGIIEKFFFSQITVTILLLLIQAAGILVPFGILANYSTVFVVCSYAIGVLILVVIFCKNIKPEFVLVWAVLICLIPVFGSLLYLFVEMNPGNGGMKKRLRKILKDTKPCLATSVEVPEEIKGIANYMDKTGHFPTYSDTNVEYFPSGEEKFRQLVLDLQDAKQFIFLEYYIIEEGHMWDTILEILKAKVQENVEVRVMYDGMGCLIPLPYGYNRKLRKMGIRSKVFAPLKPLLSTHQNNRDHRKIAVIDGKVAYTGGINLADEYINEKDVCGHWKDVAVRLEGDAVQGFTIMFLQNWNLYGRHQAPENYGKYTFLPEHTEQREGYVIPYGDNAANELDIAEDVYTDMLDTSKEYVHIMTPYFIVDHEMMTALIFAAQRGVDVKLLLPVKSDNWFAHAIAKTYYKPLIQGGVKIYEYTPGFVHAKVFVSDDCKAVVGTINLDYRSLYHHFECGAYLYGTSAVADIERDYQDTLTKCHQITMEEYKKIPAIQKIAGSFGRFIAPLM